MLIADQLLIIAVKKIIFMEIRGHSRTFTF